jgi:vacuolar iron transporter family protein
LRGLAAAEKHHVDLWAGRIQELGAPGPRYSGDLSGQAASLANRIGGADLALRRLEIDEGRNIAKYGKRLKALGDQPILEEVIADEREHCQSLGNLIRARRRLPPMPPEQAQQALDDLLTARDKGHTQAAGWVGGAIYGANDSEFQYCFSRGYAFSKSRKSESVGGEQRVTHDLIFGRDLDPCKPRLGRFS